MTRVYFGIRGDPEYAQYAFRCTDGGLWLDARFGARKVPTHAVVHVYGGRVFRDWLYGDAAGAVERVDKLRRGGAEFLLCEVERISLGLYDEIRGRKILSTLLPERDRCAVYLKHEEKALEDFRSGGTRPYHWQIYCADENATDGDLLAALEFRAALQRQRLEDMDAEIVGVRWKYGVPPGASE